MSMNLQLFAEDDTEAVETGTVEQTTQQSQKAQGKVWTDEYVQGLREEAKTNRLAKKASEAKLRKLIGLKDDEDIDDTKISTFQVAQEQKLSAALQKSNERLILAEIKSLDGYDVKLVERLLDKSKLKIEDDGTVTGLKEAITALEAEFPQIKTINKGGSPANPPDTKDGLSEKEKLIEQYNQAEKNKNFVLMTDIAEQIKKLNK